MPRQSDRHCEARRHASDCRAAFMCDFDNIVAEGLDCAKTLIDDVLALVDDTCRQVANTAANTAPESGEFTHCLCLVVVTRLIF